MWKTLEFSLTISGALHELLYRFTACFSFPQLPFVFHTTRHLIPHIIILETILRSVNTHKLCPRAIVPLVALPRPPRVILLPPSSSSPPPTYLHHDFSSLRSGSRPQVPTKWAAPRAHGTQLKVSHTGGHAVPRRDDRIDPSLRSQIPACRLFSAVLPSRSHRNRFAVADCPRSPHFTSTNFAILVTLP